MHIAGSSAPSLEAARRVPALPLTVLTIALALSLWVASGSLVLAVADGLSPHPARRLIVGVVLVLAAGSALWHRGRVCAWLFVRPRLIVAVALAELAAVAVDGLVGGPYVAFTLTSIGIAVVVAPTRVVWWCTGVLVLGYAAGVLLESGPVRLVHNGDLAGVLAQTVAYPFAALSLLGLALLFKRFLANAETTLESIRSGSPALTPALSRAALDAATTRLALPRGRAEYVRLTAMEIRVVEGLADGRSPKELAYEWGLSLSTVRTHVKHAKKKTRARTLRQLATLVAHPDWPLVNVDEL